MNYALLTNYSGKNTMVFQNSLRRAMRCVNYSLWALGG